MSDWETVAGVDVGGTFTDFVIWEDGQLRIHKRLSSPQDQSESIALGLAEAGANKGRVIHGSTVATNALLERRGAKVGLLTTAGFEDVLAIGRQNRPFLYRLMQEKDEPLVLAELRLGITERVGADGEVVTALDEASVNQAIERLRAAEVESVAIIFLWSFLNPEHEQRVAELVRAALPGVPVTVSSDLLPEYREYERTVTCVLNAYVSPPVARYLGALRERLPGREILVLQSSGGAIDVETGAKEAARMVLSGPAGGVVGALAVARAAEPDSAPKLLTFDMGGTSTDVALCDGGLPIAAENTIAGLPLRLPALDIHTVGAGGGSLAWIDDGGALRVGPQSAGADPGPACYGRGGTLPTVSDANLILGRLSADHFLGGSKKLDMEAARTAMVPLAEKLGLSVEETAAGVIRVANAAMERALRKVSVERGVDPRDFTLFPFGGAGPLHACELAEALGMRRILVAPYPGVLSALGMVTAGEWRDYSRALLRPLNDISETDISRMVDDLASEGEREISLDLRYKGQSYELNIRWTESRGDLEAAFHREHEKRFGHASLDREIEAVTLRIRTGAPGISLTYQEINKNTEPRNTPSSTALWFHQFSEALGYERAQLRPGQKLHGPAVVWQLDTTTVVAPGWEAHVGSGGILWLQRETA